MLELRDADFDVVGGHQADTDQPGRVGAAEFGEKIIVAAQAGELQFEVVEQEQRSNAEVRVQHLRVDAVEIHVLEPRDRILGALAGFRRSRPTL